MRRAIAGALLMGFLLLMFPTIGSAVQLYYDGDWHDYAGNIFQIEINGERVETDVPPVVFSDRSVVPARAIFEKLGAEVSWEERQSLVTVALDGDIITMQVNNQSAYINGAPVQMEIAPKIINDRVMIPARFVSEALGFQVDFDSSTDTIKISQPPVQHPQCIITAVQYVQEGETLTVQVFGNNAPAAVADFTLSEPARIVVDITGAVLEDGETEIPVGIQNVDKVRLGSREDGVRLVVDMQTMTGYQVRTIGTNVYVDITLVDPAAVTSVLDQITVTPEGTGDRVTSALLADSPAVASGPASVSFFVYGDLPQDEETRTLEGNILREMRYTPQEDGKGQVTLLAKGGDLVLETLQNDPFTLMVKPKQAAVKRAVILDAGHGGSDSGAIGKDADGNTIYNADGSIYAVEKEINLDVTRRVRDILVAQGVEVHMTRDSDDIVELYDIPEVANAIDAPLFVSIHTNSVSGIPGANGAEVWGYLEGGSEVNGMTSKRLSELLLREFVAATGATDRGVKDGRNLVVVRLTEMPAALVELGFITNEEECRNLMDDAYRQKCAQGIANGILAALAEMGV